MSTMHWGYLDAGNLAGIYYEQSQLDMAILHYKQAINCDSTFIEAYNNLSCFALQPNHPQALSSLGSIYMDCNMMSVPASFYKATLAVTTGISAPFNNLAIIYKQQTAADGLVNRGNTFKEIGRVTEAIQDYIRVVNIIPTMPEAHANLASAYKDRVFEYPVKLLYSSQNELSFLHFFFFPSIHIQPWKHGYTLLMTLGFVDIVGNGLSTPTFFYVHPHCLSEKVPIFIMNGATFNAYYAVGFIMMWWLALVASPTMVLIVISSIMYGHKLMELARKMWRM
ncbi:hypothetical protein ZIOFF_070383 [Zingiber officinale]|uniref:ABC transmembrane type-1 domain-containing protein n=1 Tax=Zingiber officinale TaxID=94328 RepID=A0A8J5C5I6_ZINOF|nr:hypothetical protein ZIOFF_070383 [Zingiber officinale]